MYSEMVARAVEAAFIAPLLLVGLSHVIQPGLWREIFANLVEKGDISVIYRVSLFEFVPATVIVTFHQVWTGPAVILTLYGYLLMLKIAISFLNPNIGVRSMMRALRGDSGFQVAGLVLVLLSGYCAVLVFWT